MTTLTRLDWTQPRRVDVWWWTQIRDASGISDVTGEPIVKREGTVSWNADGVGPFGPFGVFLSVGPYGFHTWPDFRALSDAQDFVERLMDMTMEEIQALHGTQRGEIRGEGV